MTYFLFQIFHFTFNSLLNFQTEACFQVVSFRSSWIPRLITCFENLPILQCVVQIYMLSEELPPTTYVHFVFLYVNHWLRHHICMVLGSCLPGICGECLIFPYLKAQSLEKEDNRIIGIWGIRWLSVSIFWLAIIFNLKSVPLWLINHT